MRAEKRGGRQDTSWTRRRKGRSTGLKGVFASAHLLKIREYWHSISLTIRGMWSLACLDLLLWRRMPLALVSALIPPLSMALMLVVLSYTVLQQPVALVKLSHGPYAKQMAELIEADTDAYFLSETSMQEAQRLLHNQEIAAILVIPPDFDHKARTHTAQVQVILNNVDIDFSDDIRRSMDRSVAMFDAPELGLEEESATNAANPYLISVAEHDLRKTDVDFLRYQVLPVLVLLVLSTGLMGPALLCAREKQLGIAPYLVLAPPSAWGLVAGRLLGGLIASLLVLLPALALCLLTGIIAPPLSHWPALLALFVMTALAAAGLGAMVGTLLRGTGTIAIASSVLAIYLFFLGGGFTTIAFLPPWLRTISTLNPMRYAIDGMRQALFYPDLTGVATDLAVLAVTALVSVVFGSIGVRRSWGT